MTNYIILYSRISFTQSSKNNQNTLNRFPGSLHGKDKKFETSQLFWEIIAGLRLASSSSFLLTESLIAIKSGFIVVSNRKIETFFLRGFAINFQHEGLNGLCLAIMKYLLPISTIQHETQTQEDPIA